jgi:methyltransferase
MTDRRYLTKEVPRILDELTDINEENVYVVDDEAFIQPRRMMELAEAIELAGIRKRYHMYVRTDTAIHHPEVMERWAAIGLDSVLVGAESMDNQELAAYQKGTTSDQTSQAIQLFHNLSVKVRANFIVKPSWVKADFDRLARTIDVLGVDMPSISVLTPLPGTDLFDQVREQLISDNPDLFDCYHTLLPTRLPIQSFYDSLAWLLETIAARVTPGRIGSDEPSVFYFSSDRAFGRMVEDVRRGYLLNDERWDFSETTTAVGG